MKNSKKSKKAGVFAKKSIDERNFYDNIMIF